jgi:LruC domain-containing protein
MCNKIIILLLTIVSLSCATDFFSSDDTTWNYHFESYSNLGGILESNKTEPLYTIDQSILDTMLNSLPERQKADIAHPEYFPTPEPEIVIQEDAEVFVTFYHEGAGYKNSLGYYTYDGDTNRTRPDTLQEVKDKGVILFPNTSLLYSGGDLTLGTSVSLGELSSGTKVLFFIVSNGWNGVGNGVRSTNDWIFTSWSPLNLEYDALSTKDVPDHKHVALLWKNVGPGNILLMGFEDILRTHNGCDHDYNDVLFSISSSPMSALSDSIEVQTGSSGFSLAPEETDTDNDGVNDAFDDYPEDAARVYNSYYPSSDSSATLLFEDMWPREGDYDMNDLSIAFSVQEVKDSQHKVKDIIFSGSVQAYGAGYTNGFALLFDTPISNIASTQMSVNGGTKYDISDNVLEDGNSTVVKLFDDAQEYLGHFINVHKHNTYELSDTFELFITLVSSSELASPPYNPFIVVRRAVKDANGSYVVMDNIEVHLPNYAPSSYAPTSLFGKLDDVSDLDAGITYVTGDNKPWALLIPSNFAHPTERVNIKNAYRHYIKWVHSEGSTNTDWYIYNKKDSQNELYADESKVIVH